MSPTPPREPLSPLDPPPKIVPTEAEVRAQDLEQQEAEAREQRAEPGTEETSADLLPKAETGTRRPPAGYKHRS